MQTDRVAEGNTTLVTDFDSLATFGLYYPPTEHNELETEMIIPVLR